MSFVRLGEQRQRRERAQQLEIAAMAVRSDAKDINARIRKDWGD